MKNDMTPERLCQAYADCFRSDAGRIVLADLVERFTPNFPSYEMGGNIDGITRIANTLHADGNKEVLLHIQGMIAGQQFIQREDV